MLLARVVGNVVATQKNGELEGHKLLLVRFVEPRSLEPHGPAAIALDAVDAGIGDLVLCIRDGGALHALFGSKKIPSQIGIVGVVDKVEISD